MLWGHTLGLFGDFKNFFFGFLWDFLCLGDVLLCILGVGLGFGHLNEKQGHRLLFGDFNTHGNNNLFAIGVHRLYLVVHCHLFGL